MTTVKRTHWFRNTLIVLIICGLIGTGLAAVLFFGESNQIYATAAIQFSFDGAAEGKAPNGYAFDVNGITSDEVLEKCRELDSRFHYTEYNEIADDTDIDRLMNVSGWFHDAVIKKMEERDDRLRVLFDGVWGCKIEVFFEGDISYNTESRNPEFYDPYWGGSTMIHQNGYFYFVDEDNMKVEDIREGYCWFKARKVAYRVIPD